MKAWEWVLVVGVLLVGGVALTVAYMIARTARGHFDRANDQQTVVNGYEAQEQALNALLETPRYMVNVKDWGPEFTGTDDILPRFRWAVRDADLEIKAVLDHPEPEVDFLMVGNERTRVAAYLAGRAWIESQQFPAVEVVGAPDAGQS